MRSSVDYSLAVAISKAQDAGAHLFGRAPCSTEITCMRCAKTVRELGLMGMQAKCDGEEKRKR